MDEMNTQITETTEAEKVRPKIIAVDFDGCLVTNKFPEVGELIETTISRLKQEQAAGAKVILWTNRTGDPAKCLPMSIGMIGRSIWLRRMTGRLGKSPLPVKVRKRPQRVRTTGTMALPAMKVRCEPIAV